jgi:phosphate transport system substrate-binding protein
MTKWASEYKRLKGDSVNYTSMGSTAGRGLTLERTVDFGCIDLPMTDEQLQKAQEAGGDIVHVPLALGAVVPTYNLEEVEKPIRFTGEVLAKIFLGKIKRWNDPELQELQQERVKLPDKAIMVVHRSFASGTTYIFADFLARHSPEWKEEVGVGTSLTWPVGVGTKGGEGVRSLISQTPGAIGYVELTYALQNNLKYGSVKNKAGHYIVPGLKSVTAAADAALGNIPEDLRYSLTDTPGKDSYPICGVAWAIVYAKQPGGKARALRDFLGWAIHDGQNYCEALHYARLPQEIIRLAEARLATMKIDD